MQDRVPWDAAPGRRRAGGARRPHPRGAAAPPDLAAGCSRSRSCRSSPSPAATIVPPVILMMMHVLLDLDGTLTDPRVGIVTSFQYALRALGREVTPEPELLRYIGPPLQETFPRLLGTDDPVQIARAIELYREHFVPRGMFENAVYPGIEAALAALRARGASLYLATSKAEVFARRILDHFGLAPLFRAVHGSELDGRRANKAELIAHVLATESIPREVACMV